MPQPTNPIAVQGTAPATPELVLAEMRTMRTNIDNQLQSMPGQIDERIAPITKQLESEAQARQTLEQRVLAVENRRPQIEVSDLDLSQLAPNNSTHQRNLAIASQCLRGWSPEKKRTFVHLVRSVITGSELSKEHRASADKFVGRALSPDSASGSYLEFTQFSSEIIRLVNEFSVIPGLCRFFPMVSDTAKLVVRSTGATVTKKAANTALDSFDVVFTQVSVNLSKIGGYTLLPVELLEDQNLNPALADFIAMEIALAISQKVDTDCILGDGTSTYDDITGLVNFAGTKEVVLGAGKTKGTDISTRDVRSCAPKLFKPARANAVWIGHESVLAFLEELNKQDLVAPLVANMNGEPIVARRPWVSSEVMPDIDSITAGNTVAILADFRFALLAGRQNLALANGSSEMAIKLSQSEHVKFIEDQVAIKGTVRMDFQMLDANAFCKLKTAAA